MSLVLVLNKNYIPVNTTTVEDAIKKVFVENAVIVVPPDGKHLRWTELTWENWSSLIPKEDDKVISTVDKSFLVPEIIKLNEYHLAPKRRVSLSRRGIYKRDHYTCQYCGAKPHTEDLSIDHVWPKSLGGKTEWTNVALACIKCNAKKSNRPLVDDPRSKNFKDVCYMKLRKKPIVPKFDVLRGKTIRIDSWQHFLGDSYWEIPLN